MLHRNLHQLPAFLTAASTRRRNSRSNITDTVTITAVQAKRSPVWKYTLAVYSASPIDPAGRPMTSAAAPDFQHRPSPNDTAERK